MSNDILGLYHFREPGGVLFEIATAEPRVGIDERLGELDSRCSYRSSSRIRGSHWTIHSLRLRVTH